jgi:hypothetical protein
VIASDTPASSSVGGADESAWFAKALSVGILRDGTIVLAVEVHQASAASSDLTFELQLNATLFPPKPPLAAPSALRATALSSSAVRLEWIDTVTNESGFRIERSIDGLNFTEVATVGSDVTTWLDDTLSPSEAVWYRVRAYNASGTSNYTSIAATSTLPGPVPPPRLPDITTFTADGYRKPPISAFVWTKQQPRAMLIVSHEAVGAADTSDRAGASALSDVEKRSLLPLTATLFDGILSGRAMY